MMKTNTLFAVMILLIAVFQGCENRGVSRPQESSPAPAATPAEPKSGAGPHELKVLCSFLPIWAFTRNVVGERPGVSVDLLIPGHQGPHDYQLTPGDMKKINQADLFIVNGQYLEEFMVEAVKKARPDLKIIEAAQGVEPILVNEEGYWPAADASAGEEAHDHERHGVNPHAFASPRDAARMAMIIAEALAAADPGGADVYRQNAAAYAARLNRLADEFRAVVEAAPNKKIVTFHNAFDYLARDSGLEIVGVIETVPGQEPSAGELARLAQKIKDSGAVAVFAEPQFSDRVARVLADEARVKLDALDPTHTGEQTPGYYEAAMQKNLLTLRRVLGGSEPQLNK